MKKIFFILAFCALFYSWASAKGKPGTSEGTPDVTVSSEASLQNNALQYMPEYGKEYIWADSVWQLDHDLELIYSSGGELVEIIRNDTAGNPATRTVYLYDSKGMGSGTEDFAWDGTSWKTLYGNRQNRTYSTEGYEAEVESEYYDQVSSSWKKSTRTSRIYDANGSVVSSLTESWQGGAWDTISRMTYNYSNDTLISILAENWNGTSWGNSYQHTDIVWDILNETSSSYVKQNWHNQAWVNDEKVSSTYGPNGSYTDMFENWDGSAWMPDYRYGEAFDSLGNLTEIKDEFYYQGKWEINYWEKSANTYMGDTLVELVVSAYDWGTMDFVNQRRTTYSDFYQVPTQIGAQKSLADLSVYPNPARNFINIDMNGAAFNTANITDLNGRIVLAHDISGEQQLRLDLSELNSGIYILQLTGDTGAAVQKIVKE